MMNRKSKSLFSLISAPLAVAAVVGYLTMPDSYSRELDAFCGDVQSITMDHDLPVSHPKNKCAKQQLHGVSWSSWFTGRSSSYQFHFIDLLELLSRSNDSGTNNPTQPNS